MLWEGWRYKRFHISYLLSWLCIGVLAGIAFGRDSGIMFDAAVTLSVLAMLLFGFLSGRWWACTALAVAGLLIGSVDATYVGNQYRMYENLAGKKAVVKGVISADTEKDNSRLTFTLKNISVGGSNYPGQLYVSVHTTETLGRGDAVVVEGTIKPGFASYGAAIGSATLLDKQERPDSIRGVRESFAASVRAVVLEPMASLGLGFVVGQRSTLPETLDEQLKMVGLTHIVVASGYNLTILARFTMRMLSRHSRYLALVGSLTLITLFVLFSGFSPSMNRAVVVSALGLLAWYYGRRFHPVQLLLYVAAGTALFNPMYVWSDLGWYLSFFAFAGILIVAPVATAYLYKRRSPAPFEQLVIETMSAEIMALPLIAYTFGTIPVFGLVANVLVAPLIPAAMALTTLTGVAGMSAPQLGQLLALPTEIVIGYMVWVVEWLSSFKVAEQEITLGILMTVIWYMGVAGVVGTLMIKMHYSFRTRDDRLEV